MAWDSEWSIARQRHANRNQSQFVNVFWYRLRNVGRYSQDSILDQEQRIAYPGSYSKQSYGESVSGGFFIWDIQGKAAHSLKFVELSPVCPFYTSDAKTVLQQQFKPASRIRVLCEGLDEIEKKSLALKVREKYGPIEVKIVDTTPQTLKIADAIEIEDLRTESSSQETLLQEWMKNKNLTKEQIQKVFALNKSANLSLPTDDVIRHVRYTIERICFDNLFSFSENNEFDLTKLKGIIGIQGKNRSGKSSLVVDVPSLLSLQ